MIIAEWAEKGLAVWSARLAILVFPALPRPLVGRRTAELFQKKEE
jgi:hypothetical protein